MNTATVRVSLAASVVLLAGAAATFAAGKYKAPRTAWGDPEIGGLYTNNTDAPFERDRNLGDKAFFTEEEYAARKSAPQPEIETRPGTTADVHYDVGDFGLQPEQSDMVKNLRTSIIMTPANGRLPPLNKDAERRSNAAGAARREHQYDSVQNMDLRDRCVIWSHEGPPLRPVAYNTQVRIMQTPGFVVLMTEMIHDARVIPIADKRPDFGGVTSWQGNSWGRWQGDTFVIETTGFSDQVMPRGSNVPWGPDAKVVEKLTRTGADTVMYEFMVTDPSLWDESWGGEYPMELTEGPMFEYACHEGNYGVANTLRGAREDEKAAARGAR
jgi:hypothetical protein